MFYYSENLSRAAQNLLLGRWLDIAALKILLPCYCDATMADSRTIRSGFLQPAFAAKGAA